MYCTKCGLEEREGQKFCPQCGKPAGTPVQVYSPAPRLRRIKSRKKIAGVCAGFAEYLRLDVTLVRIAWLLAALTGGVGFIAYIVAWVAMPVEEDETIVPPQHEQAPGF